MGRYEKNILLKSVGELGQRKLNAARVLVCGAGGLGSAVIANLASLGVGYIGIVDNDKVELSNLNRQFIHKMLTLGSDKVESAKKWVHEFNPDIKVTPYKIRLDKSNVCELFLNYDVIVDCFDNYYSKFILSDAAVKTGKTLVHGGVEEFFGQVCTIDRNSACLACFVPELYNCSIDTPLKQGIVSPVVSTVGSIQSMEIFKVITGVGTTLRNTLLIYDGLNQEFRKIHLEKNKKCPSCSGLK